jgi:hypothetical protein
MKAEINEIKPYDFLMYKFDSYVRDLWDMIKFKPEANLKEAQDKLLANLKNNKLIKIEVGEVDGLKIFLVDGSKIREIYYIDFVFGGNDEAYGVNCKSGVAHFIPDNEIWLDGTMAIHEMKIITYHEVVERYLMKEYNMTYDTAHLNANGAEKIRREEGRKEKVEV